MSQYQSLIDQAAKRYGVPSNILTAVIGRESGGNPGAESPAGAVGLMQIHLPSHPDITREQAQDPAFAIDWGARYLSSQYKRFGNWRLGLAAYNAGPGAVESGAWKGYGETRSYVTNVLEDAGRLKAAGSAGPTSTTVDSISTPAMPIAGDYRKAGALSTLQDIASGEYDPVKSLSSLALAKSTEEQLNEAIGPAPQAPQQQGTPASINLTGSGAWGGSQSIAQQFASIGLGLGLTATSEKRDRRTTASGGVSDHWTGSTNAYAYDLGGSVPDMDSSARAIMASLGVDYTGGPIVFTKNVGGYRVQVLYRTKVGGDHFTHIHVGVRALGKRAKPPQAGAR